MNSVSREPQLQQLPHRRFQRHQRHVAVVCGEQCGEVGVLRVAARLAPDVHPVARARDRARRRQVVSHGRDDRRGAPIVKKSEAFSNLRLTEWPSGGRFRWRTKQNSRFGTQLGSARFRSLRSDGAEPVGRPGALLAIKPAGAASVRLAPSHESRRLGGISRSLGVPAAS
jgi:hypothetical protein